MVKNLSESDALEKVALRFAASIEMGVIAPESISVTGLAGLAKANIAVRERDERKKNSHELVTQLTKLEQYRAQLREMIGELEAEIEDLKTKQLQALEELEAAFETAETADDLLAKIADGISKEERQQLIELIGEDPSSMSHAGLVKCLEDIRKKGYADGRIKADEAEDLNQRIKDLKTELENLKEAEKKLVDEHSFEGYTIMSELDKLQKSSSSTMPETELDLDFTMPQLG